MRFLNDFFLDGKSSVLLFTRALSELLSAKIPLPKAVKTLSEISGAGEKVRSAALEISESLDVGSSFYVSLKRVSCISFPDWYLSFASCTEKSGKLAELFESLTKILEKQNDDRNRFFSALAYPVFVAVASIAFGFLAFHFSSEISAGFSSGEKIAGNNILLSFFPGVSFLFSSYFLVFVLMNKIFSGNTVIFVFKSISFLIENSVPILEALNSCFSFADKNKKIESALLLTIERIKNGEDFSESFSKSFFEAGLKNESRILDLNLSVCKMSGKNDGFLKVAELIEKKRNSRIEKFLSVLQPFLMFVTAVFLWLLIKETFLPVITGFGGEF